MPRKLIRRWMPHDSHIREHKHLRMLGHRLHDPNLWHLNRRSVAGAVAVSFFVAWIPVPGQMLLAGLAAVWLRLNLPVSVVGVWITNPLTMPPMFFFAYQVGARILGQPVRAPTFQLSLSWLTAELGQIWQPFLLGCLVFGITSALLGYGLVRLLWRLHVMRSWQRRRRRRLNRPAGELSNRCAPTVLDPHAEGVGLEASDLRRSTLTAEDAEKHRLG
jgi:uncharacterized protein (DUF2062 family)